MKINKKISIDKRDYKVLASIQNIQPPQVPRLLIVSYLPNPLSRQILKVCIQAIQHYTAELHELWIIDNNSPWRNITWLMEWPDINLVLNRTEPVPPENRGLMQKLRGRQNQGIWASYANGVALEIAVRLIDPESHYIMPLHMDTMPSHPDWLSFLRSKLNDQVKAAGVRMDKGRTPTGVLHVLGYLVDFQLFKQLDLQFLPELPQHDVGDLVTVALRNAGYRVFACRNTLWDPQLINIINDSSPLRHFHVDRALDDDNNVIFLHLGRGIIKSSESNRVGTTPEEWIRLAEGYLLA